MKKKKVSITKIESIVSMSLFIVMFLVMSIFFVYSVYQDCSAIYKGECYTAVIKNIKKERKGQYKIKVEYEKNDDNHTGTMMKIKKTE